MNKIYSDETKIHMRNPYQLTFNLRSSVLVFSFLWCFGACALSASTVNWIIELRNISTTSAHQNAKHETVKKVTTPIRKSKRIIILFCTYLFGDCLHSSLMLCCCSSRAVASALQSSRGSKPRLIDSWILHRASKFSFARFCLSLFSK